MRLLKVVLVGVVLGLVPAIAGAQVALHGIGDLPGGIDASEVRDATRAPDRVIYAVGGSAALFQNICVPPATVGCQLVPNPDTTVLWTWDGVNGVLTPLPNFVTNVNQTSRLNGSAITPDGAYIASQARHVTSGGTAVGVRVTRSSLTNLNLNVAPYTVFTPSTGASSISDDGSILYGSGGLAGVGRAIRFDVNVGSAAIALLPGFLNNAPAQHGASSDGSVVVGTSFNAPYGGTTGGRAFRYVHGTGVSPIPMLSNGTWNKALALSSDGTLSLVGGDSPSAPNGELYFYNATTSMTTALGSPNTAWKPINSPARMTADGSVVAVTYIALTNASVHRYPYFRNGHGWFHLASALGAGGVNLALEDWAMEDATVYGISPDGTLVWGQARHNSSQEGFVAEFPANFLADFNPQPVAPSNTSIVGAWLFPNPTVATPAVLVFRADGTYFEIEPDVPSSDLGSAPGFERGLYTWNATTGAATLDTLADGNGFAGLSGASGIKILRAAIVSDSLTLSADGCDDPGCTLGPGTRITGGAGSIVGGWFADEAGFSNHSIVMVMLDDLRYFFLQDGEADMFGQAGIERGTYTWDSTNGAFQALVDTTGQWGFSANPHTMHLGADELTFTYSDGADATFTRVADAVAVRPVITSATTATTAINVPFSYTITASSGASAFTATGLPSGLTTNAGTGVISGTPTVVGSFPVSLTAANTLSIGIGALSLDVVNTAAGTNVNVLPSVLPGTGPVTLTFSNVQEPGDTTVEVVATGPPPPAGFSLGNPATYYEVATSATFSGPATICFNYSGIHFAHNNPRLFHYQGSAWVDVTTSVDTANTIICGSTTSFSPFLVAESSFTRTGFFEPVNPLAGYLNTVKGGSTVPLKFNVLVNGVQKTDIAGLAFTVAQVPCAGGTEDSVDFVTTGETTLRYDAGAHQFTQNWKTPKVAGACYVVRMTTAADGGYLTATFKIK